MVEEADVIVADSTYSSTGLGIELQIAEARGIPVVLCFHRTPEAHVDSAEYVNPDASRHMLQVGDGFVSLMALGIPSIVDVIDYAEPSEGIASVVQAVALAARKASSGDSA